MASYNGYVCALTKGGNAGITTLLSGVSSVTTVSDAIPHKYFSSGQFAVTAIDGVSGTFGIEIYGAIGGATMMVAGRTNISAVGSFPVPFVTYLGDSSVITTTTTTTVEGVSGEYSTGTGVGVGVGIAVTQNTGFPRPYCVDFVSGKSNIDSGFTASVYMCGEY